MQCMTYLTVRMSSATVGSAARASSAPQACSSLMVARTKGNRPVSPRVLLDLTLTARREGGKGFPLRVLVAPKIGTSRRWDKGHV